MRSTALTCSYSLPRASLWTERAKISSDLLFNNKNTPGMTVEKKVESAKKKEQGFRKHSSQTSISAARAEEQRWTGKDRMLKRIKMPSSQSVSKRRITPFSRFEFVELCEKKLQFWRNVCQRKEKNTIMNSSCKPRSSYLDLSIVRWSSVMLKTFRV